MRFKPFLTVLLFLIVTSTTLLNAQSLSINLRDGSKQNYELKSLQKITFSNNNLVLNNSTGAFATFGIATINNLLVSTTSDGIKNTKSGNGNTSILFNPSDNQITILNKPEGTLTVSLYRPDGVLVLKTQISNNNDLVNVSSLAKGIYLLKINNQVFKFKK